MSDLFNLYAEAGSPNGDDQPQSAVRWAADEIARLQSEVERLRGRREQFIAQANSERDSALDAEVVAWAEVDSLKSEVNRLQGLAESEIMGFMSVAVEICRQEADEWDSDRVQTFKNYAEVCGQRIEKLMPGHTKAHILNKQAEALEALRDSIKEQYPLEPFGDLDEYVIAGMKEVYTYVEKSAQRLRQQAAESAGGEHE